MRIIVYTCLFGGYDRMPLPLVESGVDYLMFTDHQDVPEPWVRAPLDNVILNGLSPRKRSRAPKILAHVFLPPHDLSIYFDANLRFKRPFVNWAASQVVQHSIAIAPHPKTSCLYDEAMKVIFMGLDEPANVRPQIERYRQEGFPRRLGLTENSFIVRANTREVRQVCTTWWNEYEAGSQRDQLSFFYALWKEDQLHALNLLPVHARENQFWGQTPHLKSRVVCRPNSDQNPQNSDAPQTR